MPAEYGWEGARATALWTLAFACCVTAGCNDISSTGDGPCEYEEKTLVGSDDTPWGTLVGEDILALVGPYPGTWTWAVNTEEIEIEGAGQVIEAEAVLEIDQSSYRLREHVSGGVGVACYGPTVQADGVLTFRDKDGVTLSSIPVTVQRSQGEAPLYKIYDFVPVPDFSSQITELSGLDDTSIRVLGNWGLESETFRVTFEYVGQELAASEGAGFIVLVAEFK